MGGAVTEAPSSAARWSRPCGPARLRSASRLKALSTVFALIVASWNSSNPAIWLSGYLAMPTVSREKATRTRADGRRSLLVYLDPDVIKQLKKAGLDEDRTAYEITEEAVRDWLGRKKA